jgi:hypothetical protein
MELSISEYLGLIQSCQKVINEYNQNIALLEKIGDTGKSIEMRKTMIEQLTDEISLYKKKVSELKQSIKTYYSIYAKPSKSNHSAHTVCYFSSLENAKKHLVKESYDMDDNCTWYYSIEVVMDPSRVSFSELDQPPEHYPYSGW